MTTKFPSCSRGSAHAFIEKGGRRFSVKLPRTTVLAIAFRRVWGRTFHPPEWTGDVLRLARWSFPIRQLEWVRAILQRLGIELKMEEP